MFDIILPKAKPVERLIKIYKPDNMQVICHVKYSYPFASLHHMCVTERIMPWLRCVVQSSLIAFTTTILEVIVVNELNHTFNNQTLKCFHSELSIPTSKLSSTNLCNCYPTLCLLKYVCNFLKQHFTFCRLFFIFHLSLPIIIQY